MEAPLKALIVRLVCTAAAAAAAAVQQSASVRAKIYSQRDETLCI